MQTWRRQVHEHLLKSPKRFCRLKRLLRPLDGIVGARSVNESISTPGIALRIHVPSLTIACGNQSEHAPVAVWRSIDLGRKMRRHALDIFHQRLRILEDVVVDALQNHAHRLARLLKDNAIRVVDVTASIEFGAHELTADFKLTSDRANVVFLDHDQSLFG